MMNLVFLNPWILAALTALPVLWFLLRITPPAPKHVVLPTTRFLAGLIPESQTPDRTPWWILLLRLLIAALVIIALARPVYNPAGVLPGSGPVRLVIDNGWAAAQTWDEQIRAAEETISQAGRDGREIYVLTTASLAGGAAPASYGPLEAAQAPSILKSLAPLPWPANYKQVAALASEKSLNDIYSIWFSHGLDEGGFNELSATLQEQGTLTYISPAPEKLPLLLRQPEKPGLNIEIAVDAPEAIAPDTPVAVLALTEDGRVLDRQEKFLKPGEIPLTVSFDIPESLRNDISRFRIAGRAGVGGMFDLDDRFRKRSVGLVGPDDETQTKPFIEAGYYLRRALEPYTTLQIGTITDILKADPSVIILPDIGAMAAADLSALEEWVRGGGMLLRFAGPNMTKDQGEIFLTPVPLRHATRSTEGTLSWENPPKLKEFPQTSPLYGIDPGMDIAVRQQILPEPVADIDQKIWATLDDGTPLITASYLDKGLLVMIHTTASPDWSDLALSGTYVEILRRLVAISGKPAAALSAEGGLLQPVWVLDGFGVTRNPDSSVHAIPAAEFAKTAAGPEHPPGLYGYGGYQQMLNFGDHAPTLKTPENIPASVRQQNYGTEYERDLMPFILYAAMVLLLFDWLVMIIMMTELRVLARFAACLLILLPFHAHAQDETQYADDLYLAYIQTGDPSLDALSRQGLENLSETLKRRTSAEPAGVAALNPETDTLAFFPLIYWPVTPRQSALSDKALKNVQYYLDHGGTILFDTRSANSGGMQNEATLRDMIGSLNIPPLAPINKDHVLTRSFYLIDTFPGRFENGTVWVETTSANGRDGVSSVIVGSNDWAGAWSSDYSPRSASGSTRRQEMSYRFGVNLVMYALTGNYKADQVHVPHILERLGQ